MTGTTDAGRPAPADRTADGRPSPADQTADGRLLKADCAQCFGLCCVVPAFAASADFALDKPAEQACPHLGADHRCGIHPDLRARGFRGCTVYDCFGAGQQVSQVTFQGRDWRSHPEIAGDMFSVFPIVRQLHELLWYLIEAAALVAPVRPELNDAIATTQRLSASAADVLRQLDVAAHRQEVNKILVKISASVRARELKRAGVTGPPPDHRGADLVGARFIGADLRGANLRGALLIGADLRDADLSWADLTGADLRDTELSGAHLHRAMFLTQAQLDSARGDARTELADSLTHPDHW
jgi:uncharacterized protein YjbI with pentapeptide repeats